MESVPICFNRYSGLPIKPTIFLSMQFLYSPDFAIDNLDNRCFTHRLQSRMTSKPLI